MRVFDHGAAFPYVLRPSPPHPTPVLSILYAVDKYHPGYFGKVGMRHFNLNKAQAHCPTINIDKLFTIVRVKMWSCCVLPRLSVAPFAVVLIVVAAVANPHRHLLTLPALLVSLCSLTPPFCWLDLAPAPRVLREEHHQGAGD